MADGRCLDKSAVSRLSRGQNPYGVSVNGGAYWRHLEPSMCGGDAALCQITLTTCYCIVLHCIVLCCVVLYCTVLYCIVLYCIVLYCIVLYCIVVCCTVFCIAFCFVRCEFCISFPVIFSLRATTLINQNVNMNLTA